jgi:hypothetical protein
MNDLSPLSEAALRLYWSLFGAREDVWALRSTEESRDHYVPVRAADSDAPLFPTLLGRHLAGRAHLAVYPLQRDQTRYVVLGLHNRRARSWKSDALAIANAAADLGVPLYLERTHSGQGMHCWIFFDRLVPIDTAQHLAEQILTRAGGGDREAVRSFERIIPARTGAGQKEDLPGPLVALPLHGASLAEEVTVFVQAQRGFPPFRDQWALLATLQRMRKNLPAPAPSARMIYSGTLAAPRPLPPLLADWLREQLVHENPEYRRRKSEGLSLKDTPRLLCAFDRRENGWLLPRGLHASLLAWSEREKVPLELADARVKFDPRVRPLPPGLGTDGRELLAAVLRQDAVLLAMPPEQQRSILTLGVIAARGQPTIIITTHRSRVQQWCEEAVLWLGLEQSDISTLEGKEPRSAFFSVSTYGSLASRSTVGLERDFGLLVLDDCTRAPADLLRRMARSFPAAYVLGLRDVSPRPDGLDDFLSAFVGAPLQRPESDNETLLDVVMRPTSMVFDEPDDDGLTSRKADAARQWNALVEALAHDERRNDLVKRDVIAEARAGHSCLVFTARREHATQLAQLIAEQIGVASAIGSMPPHKRREALRSFRDGDVPVLVVTEQLLGAGFDCPHLSRVFLAHPIKSEGQLRPIINLIMRHASNNGMPRVYDYVDENVPRLASMGRVRRRFYRREHTTLNPDATQLKLF